MNILFKNANLITMTGKNILGGELAISGDRIVFIGKKYTGNLNFDRVIDARGNIVMPGLINAHTHTPMTLMKNLSDDTNLQDWLFDNILPMEKNWDEAAIEAASRLGIASYARAGITTFCDAYYFAGVTAEVAKKTGMRASICLGFHPDDARNISEIEAEYLDIKNNCPSVSVMLYAHSIYTCDEAQFGALLSLAHKYKLPVYTHLSETLKEVGDCVIKHNITPVKLLEEYGFFDVPASVAHGVYVDEEDMQILSRYDVSLVANPASNLKLGSGIAPVYSYLKHSINVALGTDGAASNNALDMFREMYLASVLQKAQLRDASVVTAGDALKMATVNGAKALQLDKIGKLQEGYFADIIMLDTSMPNLTPQNDIESAIVYSAGIQNVVLTMVAGNILYENGQFFLDKPIDEIVKAANQAIKTLKGGK